MSFDMYTYMIPSMRINVSAQYSHSGRYVFYVIHPPLHMLIS